MVYLAIPGVQKSNIIGLPDISGRCSLEDDKYQLNNEPLYDAATYEQIWPLAHSPRIVQEGSDDVTVPEGYGIAPFLKFPRFWSCYLAFADIP